MKMAKKFINIIPARPIIMLHFMLVLQFTTAKLGCPEKCGEVSIPYPFGIGPTCSLPFFEITCNMTKDGTYTPLFHSQTLLNISLPLGQLRVNNPISSHCYNSTTNDSTISYIDWKWDFYGTPYQFNHEKNKFTVIGCDTLAYLHVYEISWYLGGGGCVSGCSSLESLTNGSCSGIGCCQTAIPKGTNYYNVLFDDNFNNSESYSFSPCSYAVLMEDDGFEFNSRYITTDELQKRGEMPVVLDWTIGDISCEVAQSNKSSYSCASENSVCVESRNYNGAPGYLCNCSNGYEGNPYLVGGCQDIDECADENNNPCSKPGRCHNTIGGYICSCPFGSSASDPQGKCQKTVSLFIGVMAGISVCVIVLISAFCTFVLTKRYKKRQLKVTRQNNFKRHYDIIYQKHPDVNRSMSLFSIEELEKATSMFDKTHVVGEGGHGIIYKGILLDQRIAAIKKPKIEVEREIEEFLNEVVILSQLNHRNVVKLFGCCLENDVPLLVYEFISNGTLTDHLHVEEGLSLSWNDRLRIALETAAALSYVHSAASISVFHRDIKTSNILLNDGMTAKLSDFGASRVVPVGAITANITNIQGTFGYLDPEYYRTNRLTAKSDVYSFGVILAELLTKMQPVFKAGTRSHDSLVAYFCFIMKEGRLSEILDPQVMEDENIGELESVAILAEKCMRLNGEERPTMKEVERQLEVLWSSKHRAYNNTKREEPLGEQRQNFIQNRDTSGTSSSEVELTLLSNFFR